MFYKDPRNIYRVRELDVYPWLDLGFGTRQSGFWMNGSSLALHQVHSDRCVWAPPPPWPEAEERGRMLGEGDALLSNQPGTYVSVRTADCIPILLVDLRRRAVAAVHAGWRGTAARIAAKAVAEMVSSGSREEDIAAAIGPGICGRCYTVGSEVAHKFQPFFPERTDLGGATRIDLPEANRRQLAAAGVGAIFTGAPCTYCSGAELHSYRKEGKRAGRLFSAAGLLKV